MGQDRSISVSSDGKQVAIQHDEEGVFVIDPMTNKPRRVYQPGPDVWATSSPIWGPDGKSIIFTVACAADGQPAPQVETPANGKQFFDRPIVYTCMLIEDCAANNEAKPVELFAVPAIIPAMLQRT